MSAVAIDAKPSGPTPKPPATSEDAQDVIGNRAVEAALPIFATWSDDIARIVSRAGSADAAQSALASWAARAKSDEALQTSIYQAAMLAAMGGHLQVRDEVDGTRALTRIALAADGSLPDRGNGPRIGFAALPFDEAVAAFLARQVVTPEEYAQMNAAARQRAFTAAGLTTQALRDEAYEGILAALQEGTTLAEFAREIRSGERTLGISPADPALIETTFRTNVASSYMAGRVAQMQSPEVTQSHPGVEFRAILDSRTTSRCVYCNGLQFDRVADPGWVRFCPPLHFNCRSTVVLLRRSQMNPSRLIRSSDVDPRGYPMDGFGGAPTLSLDA